MIDDRVIDICLEALISSLAVVKAWTGISHGTQTKTTLARIIVLLALAGERDPIVLRRRALDEYFSGSVERVSVSAGDHAYLRLQ